MQSHVCLQVVVTSESLVTLFAFKRFLTGVGSFMVLKDMFISKGSIADITSEDFFSSRTIGCSSWATIGGRSINYRFCGLLLHLI